MNPVMYIVLNKGAKMSTGKAAAQAAHAAVLAYDLSPDDNTKRVWFRGGHYTKIVLEASDAHDLNAKARYIADRGFQTAVVIDEGRTEVESFTPTAVGVQIVDKDDAHVAATFSAFKLYKDEPPRALIIEAAGRLRRETVEEIRRLWDSGDYEGAKALACNPRDARAEQARTITYGRKDNALAGIPIEDDGAWLTRAWRWFKEVWTP